MPLDSETRDQLLQTVRRFVREKCVPAEAKVSEEDRVPDRIIAEMADLPGQVVLVGHSLGGIPISATGEKVPDRIKALVYLSAFLPRDGEALLDIDYAHATAPATPVHAYMSSSLYTSIQSSVTDNKCGAISISFGYCGASSSFYTGLDSLFAQAAAQGQSVFVSTGDWGAAGLAYNSSTNACAAGTTRNPSEMAASGSWVDSVSSHRPSHPVDTSVSGTALCQMSIERKWL